MDTEFCLEALAEALERYGTPDIFNTDQGSQFTSILFTGLLEAAGIRCSMDGRGRCLDNVFIERLWRSLKYEAVYLHELKDGFEAQRVIAQWLEFYNEVRPTRRCMDARRTRFTAPVGRLQSRWRSGGGEADTAASSEHSGQVVGQYGAGTYPHIHRLGHPPPPDPHPPLPPPV